MSNKLRFLFFFFFLVSHSFKLVVFLVTIKCNMDRLPICKSRVLFPVHKEITQRPLQTSEFNQLILMVFFINLCISQILTNKVTDRHTMFHIDVYHTSCFYFALFTHWQCIDLMAMLYFFYSFFTVMFDFMFHHK